MLTLRVAGAAGIARNCGTLDAYQLFAALPSVTQARWTGFYCKLALGATRFRLSPSPVTRGRFAALTEEPLNPEP